MSRKTISNNDSMHKFHISRSDAQEKYEKKIKKKIKKGYYDNEGGGTYNRFPKQKEYICSVK